MRRKLHLAALIIALVSTSAIAQYAHFPFDTDALDAMQHINSTPEASGISFVSDVQRGDVLEMDGTNGFITYPGNDIYDFDALTYNLWFQWNTTVADQWWVRVFDFGIPSDLDPHPGNHDVVFATLYQEGLLQWHIHSIGWEDGADTVLASKEPIILGDWYMLTCTHDADSARLYLNGELQSSKSVNGVKPSDMSFTHMYLGKANWPDPLFMGKMDDFRVYEEVLSAEAIADLYVIEEPPSAISTNISEGINIYAYGSKLVMSIENPQPNASYSVYNLLGVEVMHETNIGSALEINNLKSGMYIVKVTNGIQSTAAKVYIQ